MANKIIDLTGDEIENALQLVHTSIAADQSPAPNSTNLVTSGTLHTYIGAAIQGSLNNGPKITSATFADTTLVDSNEGLANNISNDKLATTGAIRDFVLDQPRATISHIFWAGGNNESPVTTNLNNNATINVTLSGPSLNRKATINIVANMDAQYLILGSYSNAVQPGIGGGSDLPAFAFRYFNASNLDVLINETDYNNINLSIIRFA